MNITPLGAHSKKGEVRGASYGSMMARPCLVAVVVALWRLWVFILVFVFFCTNALALKTCFWTLTLVYNKGSEILFTSILSGRRRLYEKATAISTVETCLQGNKEGNTEGNEAGFGTG